MRLLLTLLLLACSGMLVVGAPPPPPPPDNAVRAVLVVPYKEYLSELPPADRLRLEDALGGDLAKLMDVGLVKEGDMVDFQHPAVWFVYNLNKWARLQSTSQGTINVRAVEQWQEVETSWLELRKRVKEAYRF